jgi:HrpA-like RNA helicase
MSELNNIGILDPEGSKPNPLNDMAYSSTYTKWSKIWSKYPAYKLADEIINKIKSNQVLIVTAGTGTGKTVLVPKFALHALKYSAKIAVTLPKQILAKSQAEFSAITLDVTLGQEVSYQYKGADVEKSEKTKLLYATDGTIVARLLKDPQLTEFGAVVMDEAHERNVRIDFLLYLLRNTLKLRPDFKLIIMSATLNAELFKSYYGMFNLATVNIEAPSNYPITSHYLPEPIKPSEYLTRGYNIMKKIISEDDPKKEGAHDILFFITSVNEAMDICSRIKRDNIDGYCIEVYSGMDPEREELAKNKLLYKEKSDKSRKIVLATPVAESSLTIDGLKYVIESGYEFASYYDPETDTNVLEKKFITQAQVGQRIGRAGRTEPGIAYHLYTKDQYQKMAKYPEPSIRTSDITTECLKLIQDLKTTDKLIETLTNFIEPPREKYLRNAIVQLREMNLITNDGITEFGYMIAEMQMDPMVAMTFYAAKKLRCMHEVASIICTLDASKGVLSELFTLPTSIIPDTPDNKDKLRSLTHKFNDIREKYKNRYGDHIALLKIFEDFIEKMSEDKKRDFCYKNFLKYKTLAKAESNYTRLKNTMKMKLEKVKEYDYMGDMEPIDKAMACFYYGYRTHLANLQREDLYDTSRVKGIKVNRYSYTKFLGNIPKTIIYQELFNNNGKLELNIVSNITPKVREILNYI